MEPLGIFWIFLFFCMLFLATVLDLTKNKIPNYITFSGILLGFVVNAIASNPLDGLLSSFYGFLVCFFIFIPFYALGGVGAGDVKLMAAAGSVLGFQGGVLAVGYTLLIGALLGFILLVWKSGLANILSRYRFTFKVLVTTGVFLRLPDENKAPLKQRFPYAIAIATGAVSAAFSTGRVAL